MRECCIKPEYVPFMMDLFYQDKPKLSYRKIAIALNRKYGSDIHQGHIQKYMSYRNIRRNKTYKKRTKVYKKPELPSLSPYQKIIEVMCKGKYTIKEITSQINMIAGIKYTTDHVNKYLKKLNLTCWNY